MAAFAILLRDNPKDAGINLAGVAELAESAKGADARGLPQGVRRAGEEGRPAAESASRPVIESSYQCWRFCVTGPVARNRQRCFCAEQT